MINHDIEEFRLTRFFPRLLRNVWTFAVATGVVGWCLIEGVRYLFHLFRRV